MRVPELCCRSVLGIVSPLLVGGELVDPGQPRRAAGFVAIVLVLLVSLSIVVRHACLSCIVAWCAACCKAVICGSLDGQLYSFTIWQLPEVRAHSSGVGRRRSLGTTSH